MILIKAEHNKIIPETEEASIVLKVDDSAHFSRRCSNTEHTLAHIVFLVHWLS
jgi:hypothetical protein